jgi:hypothetical protein
MRALGSCCVAAAMLLPWHLEFFKLLVSLCTHRCHNCLTSSRATWLCPSPAAPHAAGCMAQAHNHELLLCVGRFVYRCQKTCACRLFQFLLRQSDVCVAGKRDYEHEVPGDQTLLHNLMAAKQKDNGQPLTDTQISAQSFTFILAGQSLCRTSVHGATPLI